MERVSSNRWELQRTPQGWKVSRRINRLMKGDEESRRLAGRGFEPGPAATA